MFLHQTPKSTAKRFFKKVSVHKAGRTQETTTTTFRKREVSGWKTADSAHPRAKPQIGRKKDERQLKLYHCHSKDLKLQSSRSKGE